MSEPQLMPPPPQFRFEMWAVSRPRDPYYHTNWDNKKKITVVAPDQDAAIKAAKVALGHIPRYDYWLFEVVSITDHRIPE